MAQDEQRPETGVRARLPKWVSLDLSQDEHDALMDARYADRIPMNDRLRTLVSTWRQDPELAAAVNTRAQELLEPSPRLRPARPPSHALSDHDAGASPAS